MAKPPDLNVQASFPNLQSIHLPKESTYNSSQLEKSFQPQMAKSNISAVHFPPAMEKSKDENAQVLLANGTPTSTTNGTLQFTNLGNLGNQFGPSQTSAHSYARAVQGSVSSFNGVKGVLGYERLPPRRRMKVENKPAIIFSNLELMAANSKLRHSMVLKFSSGRPTILQIQEHIKQNWKLHGDFVVSLIDPRHVGVYIGNEDDLRLALSKESHIINKCMYRAFRWTPEFNLKEENPVVAVWIRLPGIPWAFYNGALLECIGNELGRFLRVDDRTLGLTNQLYARMCVEIDVSKPLETEVWIGESKDNGFWQKVQYEGNIAYCSGCGLLGHSLGICRKAKGRNEFRKVTWSMGYQERADGKRTVNNEGENRMENNDIHAESSSLRDHLNVLEKVIEQKGRKQKEVEEGDNASKEVDENPVVEITEKTTDIVKQKKNTIQIDLDNGSGEILSDDQLYDKEMRRRSRQKEKEKQNLDQISGRINSSTGNGKTDAAVDTLADGFKKSNSEAKKVDNVATVEQRRKCIESNEAKKVDEAIENQFLKPTTEEQHRILNEKDSMGFSEEEIRYNSLMEDKFRAEKQRKEELEVLGPCTLNMEDSCPSSKILDSPIDEKEIEEKNNEKEIENSINEEIRGDDEEEYQLYVGKIIEKRKGMDIIEQELEVRGIKGYNFDPLIQFWYVLGCLT